MPLTNIQIQNAKAGAKLSKLSDGGGLQLWIFPDGAKRWRLAYRFNGKQKLLALGVYPAVSLKQARDETEKAKKLLADKGNAKDPSIAKQDAKIAHATAHANTFEAVASELVDKKRREGRADTTLVKIEWLLSHAYPTIGSRAIAELKAPEILQVLRQVEARGKLESARRLRSVMGEVFRYAVATGRAQGDPTGALRGAIAAPTVKHRAAITDPVEFGHLLRALPEYRGTPETIAALKMIPLVFVRPGELRAAEWVEFDLDRALWLIPAARMKMRQLHRIPLAAQTLAILRDLQALTGDGKYLFPSIRSRMRCMSENTINAALRRLGFTSDVMCGHGFRSSASSLLNESGRFNPDAIERQLAHLDDDEIRATYHRAEYWEERVAMMAWWANKCDELRNAAASSASALATA